MLVVMKNDATEAQVQAVIREIESLGFRGVPMPGALRTAICIIGNTGPVDDSRLLVIDGVKETIRVTRPYKLVSRETQPQPTVIAIGDIKIGEGKPVVMAGPCAIESEEQALTIARLVKKCGAQVFRGGAFKPRTSPYSFQGLGEEGLAMLARAREVTGLPIVTEVLDVRDIEVVARYADVLQVGARNMQNFLMLRDLGFQEKPVLLKRGMSSTVEEWLMAAEYILKEGNKNVILCERGIRTFEPGTRNTLDISAVPAVKNYSHLPIIVDPSHATGVRELVSPLCKAALAAGADGVMVEMHPNPREALCDGPQSLTIDGFKTMMDELMGLAAFLNRK